MVVSAIRSAYSATVRFYRHTDDETTILWYFVPETGKPIPWPHAFNDTVWSLRNADLPQHLGEVFTDHVYSKGLPPAVAAGSGATVPCGSKEQWQSGCLSADPVPGVWPSTLVPVCCPPPVQPSLPGGLGKGGYNFEPACFTACGIPEFLTLSVPVVVGACAGLEGSSWPMHPVVKAMLLGVDPYTSVCETETQRFGGIDWVFGIACQDAGDFPYIYVRQASNPFVMDQLFDGMAGYTCSPFHFRGVNVLTLGTCSSHVMIMEVNPT